MRARRVLLAVVPGLAIGALAGCRHGPPPPHSVLLIIMDTTRADHLGAYGSARPTTPFLDSLARRGALFEHVISPAATTPASIGSMLTGVLPFEHGVRSIESLEASHLDPKLPTLAEILHRRGFATAAFVSAIPASSRYGFARGFDLFEESGPLEEGEITAAQVNAKLLPWLRARPKDQRFFCLAHYFDVHDLARKAPDPYLHAFVKDGMKPIARRIALYDGELSYLDSQLARVIETLKEAGLDQTTDVIVLADHGEGLGDHGHMGHGILYQEQIHVPFIVAGPGVESGVRVKPRLWALDLAPTILDLAGVPAPERPSHYRGRSLRPWLEGRRGQGDALIVAESHNVLLRRPGPPANRARGEVYAALRGRWKYLYYPIPDKAELYDLYEDPQESVNRVTDEPGIAAELRAVLDRLRIMSPLHGKRPDLDQKRLEQLRSLGYVQ